MSRIKRIHWCCFKYSIKNGLVALLETLFARIFLDLRSRGAVILIFTVCVCVRARRLSLTLLSTFSTRFLCRVLYTCEASYSIYSIYIYIWMSHQTHVYGTYVYSWMKQISHMNEPRHICECATSHIWMSHVTHMNESRHTYECAMSHIWISHVTRTNLPHHTYEWVTAHVWMSHAAHMDKSRYAHA